MSETPFNYKIVMFRKMEERTDDIIREEVEEDNQSFTTDSFQVNLNSCLRLSTKEVFHFVEPSQNLVVRSYKLNKVFLAFYKRK